MKPMCLIALLLAVASCSSTTDITKNPTRMTDFVVGQTYQLRKNAFVWRGRLMPRDLVDSEAVLTPGTILAVRKVEVDRSPEMGTVTDVFAEVTSGRFKGKVVNVTWVSTLRNDGHVKRNPEVLEPVESSSE